MSVNISDSLTNLGDDDSSRPKRGNKIVDWLARKNASVQQVHAIALHHQMTQRGLVATHLLGEETSQNTPLGKRFRMTTPYGTYEGVGRNESLSPKQFTESTPEKTPKPKSKKKATRPQGSAFYNKAANINPAAATKTYFGEKPLAPSAKAAKTRPLTPKVNKKGVK